MAVADTWTPGADWAANEKPVASSKLNQQVRDNINVLQLGLDGDGSTSTIKHRHLCGTHAAMPAAGEPGRIYFVTSGAMQGVAYRDDGTNWAPLGVQVAKRDATEVDVVSSVAETTVFSETIKGGDLGTTGGLRVTLGGDLLKNTTGILTLRIGLGATGIFAGTFSLTSSSTLRKWLWTILMLNNASASAQKWVTEIHGVAGGASFSVLEGDSALAFHAIGYNVSAENTGGDLLLDASAQWSGSSGNLSFRKEMAVLELLPALT